MNKSIPIILFVLILGIILYLHILLPTPLFSPDGVDHWYFSTFQGCTSGYPSVGCWITQPLMFSPWAFWGLFFVIAGLIIPYLFYRYTKNLWILPAYFVFSGFFWNAMAMQVFAQIILSAFLVFFILEKNWKIRAIIFGGLLIGFSLGFNIHNTEEYFLIGIFVIEIVMLFEEHVRLIIVPGFTIISSDFIGKVSSLTAYIRGKALSSAPGLTAPFYYIYHFLFSEMFVGFMLPAIWHIIKSRDFRTLYFFIFVLFGALITWYWQGYTIWGVTRVFLWIPLVLLVPFVGWLQNQSRNTKMIFYGLGILYFLFNLWYFYVRIQEMAFGY